MGKIIMDKSTYMPPKRKKFRELAEKRTSRALKAISTIGNLSNRQLYEWEDKEIRKIIKALKDEADQVEKRFASPKGRQMTDSSSRTMLGAANAKVAGDVEGAH